MKTNIVHLIGDPITNLTHLGIRERDSFFKLEERVIKLLSLNPLLRYGQDIISRARHIIKKKEKTFFDQCIEAYSSGLGIEPARYFSFISLFELAAHYGQIYPELKGLLPGCTSVFQKTDEGFVHARLLDFPLIGIFDEAPRLYYWQFPNKKNILSFSTEGLAPLFFHAIHESGMSFALHHKPSDKYDKNGMGIFEIIFETLMTISDYQELKKEIKKKNSITKWGMLFLDKSGQAAAIDIEGPALNVEAYDLNHSSPVIFTNIPLQKELTGHEAFIRFSNDRQNWLKEKLSKTKSKMHLLDIMTNIDDQKEMKWVHPASTLSTVHACCINLTQGFVDIKEGKGALVKGDAIYRVSLDRDNKVTTLKNQESLSDLQMAWKKAAIAQSKFDQGNWNEAYHELQMAQAMMPQEIWKNIFSFYLCLWDFKFITNMRELALVYKKLQLLKLPPHLKDQWLLSLMRMEKRLNLTPTVKKEEISPPFHELFLQEKSASTLVFTNWMKLLYPRMEILDVFSPHQK